MSVLSVGVVCCVLCPVLCVLCVVCVLSVVSHNVNVRYCSVHLADISMNFCSKWDYAFKLEWVSNDFLTRKNKFLT